MSSPRSDLNPVLRDPDTTFHMVAPGPPGPLMTDEHDGAVNDALVGTNPTAQILNQINPSINPYNLNNDALVKDLARYFGVGHHGDMNGTTTAASSASRCLHDLQPNKHSGLKTYKPFQQKSDDQLQNVINGVSSTFKSCASVDCSADILNFKTVLDEATSSTKPSTPSNSPPDIHHQLNKIPKHQILRIQGIHPPACGLAVHA